MATDVVETTDAEKLYNALTEYECGSYEDIAGVTGWPVSKVGMVLVAVRSSDQVRENGWTVPHVPRGPGRHLFQAVLVNGGESLDDVEQVHVLAGAHSTSKMVATMGRNEATALDAAAKYAPTAEARQMRQTAEALRGAAGLSENTADALLARLERMNSQ